MKIIDFHTHAFADALAERAIGALCSVSKKIVNYTDGTIGGLRRSMKESGVGASVIANIATKPGQFKPILEWSKSVAAEDIIPFGSVHPDYPELDKALEELANSGIKGLKVHSFYQSCPADDRRMFPIYEAWQAAGKPILFHAGFDVAFKDMEMAGPQRFKTVLKNFPKLKMVLAHMGSWKNYEDFYENLCGGDFYIDTSCSALLCSLEMAKKIVSRQGAERVLFATDCPWGDQKAHIEYVKAICPKESEQELVFHKNAEMLLGL